MARQAFLHGYRHGDPVAHRAARRIDALEFRTRAGRLADSLPAGRPVANLCTDRLDIAVALAAALLRGQPCIMPPDRAPETLAGIQQRFRPTWIVSNGENAPYGAFTIDEDTGTDHAPPELAFAGEQTAVIMFTSGTTGQPRAHEKTWASLASVGRHLGDRFALRPGSAVVATVPGQHMFGLEASIMLPLQNGGILVSERPLFPEDVRRALHCAGAGSALVTTPVHLRACVGAGIRLPDLQFVLSATAPMDRPLARQTESATGAPVVEMYGCTEAGSVATRRSTDGAAWLPLPALRLAFYPGDQCVVTADYLQEPVALQDRIEPGANGTFNLLGRSADMVNIAGKRASLQDLTLKVLALDGVEDAALFLPDDGPSGEVRRLSAFIVAPGLTADELRRRLRRRLDPAFLPRPLTLVEGLPRNETGKLSQRELMTMYRRHAERGGEA